MAFTFGAPGASGSPTDSTSSTPTAAGGSSGGFSFGNTATPQPAPAPGAFSFGSSCSSTPAPAFVSFSATPSPAPGASSSTTANPSVGGFGVAPVSSTPATSFSFGSSAPAPSTRFSFGSSPAPSAPATGFSYGGSAPSPAAPSTAPPTGYLFAPAAVPLSTPVPQAPTLKVPDYSSLFHGDKWKLIKTCAFKALKNNGRDAQELEALIQENAGLFLDLLPPAPQQADMGIRQRLASHPEVELMGKPASLTKTLFEQILELADDLRVSEEVALCLYAHVSSSASNRSVDLAQAARQSWFVERRLPVEVLLLLSQYRLESPSVVQATDALLKNSLIPNAMKAVRDYTTLIQNLLNELSARDTTKHAFSSMSLDPTQTIKPDKQASVNLEVAGVRRQTLCHVLFFLAYHTQWNGDEVAALLDLVRDLSNDLRVLDPFHDVPSPYEEENPGPAAAAWMNQWQPTPLAAKEKDVLQWQRELVKKTHKTGQPELLKCVSTLVMAVMCALDAQTELVDRSTHQINSFGTGNALLSPITHSTDNLVLIHNRLNKEAAKDWKRADILGVLMASFALLLRSSPSSLSSPRGSITSPSFGSSIDVRKSWRECLEAPTELKSFTFGRLGLIPALLGTNIPLGGDSNEKRLCDATEFLLSVLARFASSYMDVLSASGDMPISRKKWEQDAEEDLRLRRSHQEQQRQFQAWSGTLEAEPMEVVPMSVDLLLRPDCMDDVIAFAVAVCSLGPNYSSFFWSTEEQVTGNEETRLQLLPSRALLALDRQQEDDESLVPSYLSMLAALASAEGGSEAIHRMMSGEVEVGRKGQVTWASLVEILRWYTRELNSPEYGGTSAMKAAPTMNTSTSYYYAYEDTRDVSGSNMPGSWAKDASGDSSTAPNTRDLGEASSFVLMSHLHIISKVCRGCPAARAAILSTNLPIQGTGFSGSPEVVGQDSTLMILFTLAVAPLPPDIRGAVFSTLSYLLKADPCDEAFSKIQESATTAWQMLDQCQILPIYLLDQYPSIFDKDPKNSVGLTFPPASTALVADKPGKSWIPPKPMYSILYELEYIESAKGVYPTTEGFLRLLRSLFDVAGSPQDLGRSWRVRCGCTPYIEYVMHLVLPRTLGTFPDCFVLPFRSSQDKSRLVSLALEVIQVIVTRYQLPPKLSFGTLQPKDVTEHHRQLATVAMENVGVRSLANHVVTKPSIKDARLFICDWQTSPTEAAHSADVTRLDVSMITPALLDQSPLISSQRAMGPSTPRPKSPALSILVDLLHSSGGQLFQSIVRVLVDSKSPGKDGVDADEISLGYALFNATPPTFSSAKIGMKKTSGLPLQSLLLPLQDDHERLCFSSAVEWEERATLLALNVLCAAVVREDQLQAAVNSMTGSCSIVPVLSFRKRNYNSTRLDLSSLQLSKLSQLLLASNVESGVLCQITDLTGYHAVDDQRDIAIAQAAISLVFYVDKILLNQNSVPSFYRTLQEGELKLAQAFGSRIVASGRRVNSKEDVEVVSVILNRVLVDLRKKTFSTQSISNTLLGFPSNSSGVSLEGLQTVVSGTDCFDALLFILDDEAFVSSLPTSELAAMGFEVFARLMTVASPGTAGLARVQRTAERLRCIDFWRYHLAKILVHLFSSKLSSLACDQLLHSAAWLLESLACEVDLLQGSVFGTPQPVQFDWLMTFLYAPASEIIGNFIRLLPIGRLEFSSTTVRPTEETLRKSKVKLNGAPELVDGYELIDCERLVEICESKEKAVVDELKAWCDIWNLSVSRDCATAHLSSAIYLVLGASVATDTSLMARIPSVCIGWNNLLPELLSTMTVPKLDSTCFSTATRNLALAALVVAKEMTVAAGPLETVEGNLDAASARSMAAAAIAFSGGPCDYIGSEAIRHERTALLGTVLSLLLGKTSSVDIENDAIYYVDAATALARLSSNTAGSAIPIVPSNQALIARACLSVIFDKFQEATLPGWNQLFLQRVLFQPHNGSNSVSSLVHLVASLDWNAAHLLQSISGLPVGSQILLDSDVLEALSAASYVYKKEESKVLTASVGSAYQDPEIGIPPFLPGHLELMISLMAIDVDGERSRYIGNTCLRILSNYGLVLEHIISQFPANVGLVQLVSRCFWGIKTMLHTVGKLHSGRIVEGEDSPGPMNQASDALEQRLLTLAVHIVNNPLPLNFFPALPDRLLASHARKGSVAVTLSTPDEKSWWDSLKASAYSSEDSRLRAQQLSSEICAYAVIAADITKNCLWVCRNNPMCAGIDSTVIARGLCRCSDALRVIDLSLQGQFIWNELNVFAFEDGRKLRSLLGDIVVELLAVLLRRMRLITKGDAVTVDVDSAVELKKTIRVALDHSRLEVPAFRSTTTEAAAVDENRPDYVMELARTLRCELEDYYQS